MFLKRCVITCIAKCISVIAFISLLNLDKISTFGVIDGIKLIFELLLLGFNDVYN